MPHNQNDIQLNITFRNTEPTDAIKSYAEDKIMVCLNKYVHHNTKAHVILSVEKTRHSAEVVFHADGNDFRAKEETPDMYSSIDQVVGTLSTQLRKNKEKLTAHHR